MDEANGHLSKIRKLKHLSFRSTCSAILFMCIEDTGGRFDWFIMCRGKRQSPIPGHLGAIFLSFFLSILSRSNFDHHLRCGGWLNFEFS